MYHIRIIAESPLIIIWLFRISYRYEKILVSSLFAIRDPAYITSPGITYSCFYEKHRTFTFLYKQKINTGWQITLCITGKSIINSIHLLSTIFYG